MNQQSGITAIKNAQVAAENWNGGVVPFMKHQLEVVDPVYWQTEVGTAHPSYSDIVELLVSKGGSADYQDFGLPDINTPPVIRVSYTESGDPVIRTVNT